MSKKTAHIIVGCSFGDEGKGTITDFLCREFNKDLVIRYNGGSQAAHNVVTSDGKHHTFSQLGSGSFIPSVKTYLSEYMLFDPMSYVQEYTHFQKQFNIDISNRCFVNYLTPVITPFHASANRIIETIRSDRKHGSCGKGIGELAYDILTYPKQVIKCQHLSSKDTLFEMLSKIQKRKQDEIGYCNLLPLMDNPSINSELEILKNREYVEKILEILYSIGKNLNVLDERKTNDLIKSSNCIFEGAQGFLLDEKHGFHPHTTWSNITNENAKKILHNVQFNGKIETVGVIRSFSTRHGNGPFVTKNTISDFVLENEHNKNNMWQGDFFAGAFDNVMFGYAFNQLNLNSIAITHLDVFDRMQSVPLCKAYKYKERFVIDSIERHGDSIETQEKLTTMLFDCTPVIEHAWKEPNDLIRYVEKKYSIPVKYISSGPKSNDKKMV